jgi:uncharacterized HAD superfamily protein
MTKKTSIAFDIDGVVINFTESFLRTAMEKFGMLKNVKYSDVTRYAFYECLDISRDKCFEIVDYVLNNHFECNVRPVKGSVEVLTTLSKDMDLVFVTARKNIFKQQTKELIYYILPDVDKDKITIIHQKGSEKYKILNNLNIKYFVDDKLTTCSVLKQHGIRAILYDNPWNQKEINVDRVLNWNELSEYLTNKNINGYLYDTN